MLAGEVGGRFSDETAQFLRALASAKVREGPQLLQGRAHAAWLRRWSAMLACAAARAFAPSCSVFEGWGVGLQRFSRGVGGCSSLSEARGRVGLDRFIRDLDVGASNPFHGRRIEVIVDVLSLWHGAQLAVNTTLVSAWRRHCTTARSHHERCGFAGSSQGEGNHIPRTLR